MHGRTREGTGRKCAAEPLGPVVSCLRVGVRADRLGKRDRKMQSEGLGACGDWALYFETKQKT